MKHILSLALTTFTISLFAQSKPEVLSAWYGVEGNAAAVTQKLKEVVDKYGFIVIPADMWHFYGFDPVPGVHKMTGLHIRHDGKEMHLRAKEGVRFLFPANADQSKAQQALNDVTKSMPPTKLQLTDTAYVVKRLKQNMTPLRQAVTNGDLEKVKELLNAGANPNEDMNGFKPLHLIVPGRLPIQWKNEPEAARGELNRIRIILKEMTPERVDIFTQIIKHLIAAGADPNATYPETIESFYRQSVQNLTPLETLARYDLHSWRTPEWSDFQKLLLVPFAKALIESGASLNKEIVDFACLHHASLPLCNFFKTELEKKSAISQKKLEFAAMDQEDLQAYTALLNIRRKKALAANDTNTVAQIDAELAIINEVMKEKGQ